MNEVATGSGMISVKKDGEEIDRIDAEIDFDLGLNQMVINLANALTEQGIYTFDIPAGYFLNENGDELPAFTLTYGIGMETGINHVTTLNAAANTVGAGVKNAVLAGGGILKEQVHDTSGFVQQDGLGFAIIQSFHS